MSLALAAALLGASSAAAEGPPVPTSPPPASPPVRKPAPAKASPAKPAAAAKPATPAPPAGAGPASPGPLVAGIVVSVPAPLADWRPLDPENTLILDTDKGRIIIELRPEFAPAAVARIKRLARSGIYEGLLFHRVIDGFMAQTGNPNNMDGGKSQEPDLPPEFTFRLGAEIPRAQVARPLGESEGFIGAQPYVSVDEIRMAMSPDRRVSAWGAYCPGVVGMGHQADPGSGNSEFFIMRGATRTLDRGYSVVGRVIVGLDVARALTVGDPPGQPSRMLHARILADLPESQRPQVMVLNTLSPEFHTLVEQVRTLKGADFSICDVDVPMRVTEPAPAAQPATKRRRHARAKPAEPSA